MKDTALIIFSIFLFISCQTKTKVAIAVISPKQGSNISGKVIFKEVNGKVKMEATINNLKQGNHAIHIHEKGDCSSADAKSAGGHWNPTNQIHGKWNIPPFHSGDIGNINPNGDSKGYIKRETDLWCIGCDDKSKDILGKAIIIHEGPDDFSSQPSGAAGARIGCGVIEKQ